MKKQEELKMTKNIAEALSALRQEVKDFKNEVICDIKEIKEQTKMTNGSVARNLMEIEKVKQKQESCPARQYYQTPNRKDWWNMLMPVAISIVSVLATFYLANRFS